MKRIVLLVLLILGCQMASAQSIVYYDGTNFTTYGAGGVTNTFGGDWASLTNYNVFTATSNKFNNFVYVGDLDVQYSMAVSENLILGDYGGNARIDCLPTGSGGQKWYDEDGTLLFDFKGRLLYDENTNVAVSFGGTYSLQIDGQSSVEWGNRFLVSTNRTTLDWGVSKLYGVGNGVPVMDWSTHTLLTNEGVWKAEGQATNGDEIVNYQTMTNYCFGLSVTNTWISGPSDSVTNVQVFINGQLRSWTTNGVALP